MCQRIRLLMRLLMQRIPHMYILRGPGLCPMPPTSNTPSAFASTHNRGDASASSCKSAIGQFNAYIRWNLTQIQAGALNAENQPVTREHRDFLRQRHVTLFGRITGTGSLRPPDESTFQWLVDMQRLNRITAQDMDMFAMYLAKSAKQRKPGCQYKSLSANAADRYLSAIKTYITHDAHIHNYTTPLSDQSKMKKIRDGMMNVFIERHKQSGMFNWHFYLLLYFSYYDSLYNSFFSLY